MNVKDIISFKFIILTVIILILLYKCIYFVNPLNYLINTA